MLLTTRHDTLNWPFHFDSRRTKRAPKLGATREIRHEDITRHDHAFDNLRRPLTIRCRDRW